MFPSWQITFWSFSLISVSLFSSVSSSFEIQIFGDYVHHENYKSRNFCSTKYCIFDNNRLIEGMSQNKTIRPCDDFKTFAMGEFLATRVVNERYPLLGFELEVVRIYNEKMRKILELPIADDETKMFKVVKSFYQKCVDSDMLRSDGPNDVIKFLNEAGGSPLTDASWDESLYNVSTLFNNPQLSTTELFLNHELSRCNDPRNSANQVLCFKHKNDLSYTDLLKNDILQMLKSLKLKETFKPEMLEGYLQFLKAKQTLDKEFHQSEKRIVHIKDLPQMFPNLILDWVELLNQRLLRESRVSDEDEIGIESPILISKLSELLVKSDKRTIANAAAISFLYENRQFFIAYSFDKQTAKDLHVKKSVQRFERCILHLNFRVAPALQAVAAKTYFNKSLQTSAQEMAKEVSNDLIYKIEEKIQIDDEKIKKNLIENLKGTKISIMYPDELLNVSIVEEFYDDLEIDYSQSSLQMFLNMTSYHQKILNEKRSNWKRRLNTISETFSVTFLKEENLIVVPRDHAFYPSFHPDRPRFFNMATFYANIAGSFYNQIEDFLLRKTGKASNLTEIHPFVLMDENYLAWEAAGGKDLELSAFRLTNRQMMWLALANRMTVKVHRNFPIINENLKKVLNLHELFMSFEEFRDAYQCNEK